MGDMAVVVVCEWQMGDMAAVVVCEWQGLICARITYTLKRAPTKMRTQLDCVVNSPPSFSARGDLLCSLYHLIDALRHTPQRSSTHVGSNFQLRLPAGRLGQLYQPG